MKKRRLLHFVPLTLRRVKRRAKFSNTASSLDPSNASFPFTIVAIVRTVRGGRWWKVSLNFSRFVVRLSNSASVRPKRKHGINWYLPKCLPQRRKGVGSHARAGNWFVFTANADRTCSLTEWSDFRAPWCLPVAAQTSFPPRYLWLYRGGRIRAAFSQPRLGRFIFGRKSRVGQGRRYWTSSLNWKLNASNESGLSVQTVGPSWLFIWVFETKVSRNCDETERQFEGIGIKYFRKRDQISSFFFVESQNVFVEWSSK